MFCILHYMFRPTLVIIRCLNTRSLDTQHNRKSHPVLWNTRARRWDHATNMRIINGNTAVFTDNFYSENPVILNLKDVLDNHKS
jgi:hypothetical protein